MVKELDLFESNHGCGLNALFQGKHPKTNVTKRYTVQNWCVTYSQGNSERVGASTMVSAPSSILTLRGQAGLCQQCLSQRVVTPDEKLISRIQPFQEPPVRSAARFSIHAAVTIAARQDEVPHAIEVQAGVELFERVGKEVVNVGAIDPDIAETVEALPLLVAVERIAAAGQAGPAATARHYEVQSVHIDRERVPAHLQLPGSLH
jgi:hypothetical protein